MFAWFKKKARVVDNDRSPSKPFDIQLLILMISDGELLASPHSSFISICSNHNKNDRTTKGFEQMFVFGERKHGNGSYCIEFGDDKVIQRITRDEYDDLLSIASGMSSKTDNNIKIIEKYFSDKYLNSCVEKLNG